MGSCISCARASRDLRCVFVQTVDPYKGTKIHRADAVQIKSLAARLNIPDLLRAR